MLSVGTFRGFLHKLYAATMDGNGREGTYNFSHDDWGQPGAGHRAQRTAAPTHCHPAGAGHGANPIRRNKYLHSCSLTNETKRKLIPYNARRLQTLTTL